MTTAAKLISHPTIDFNTLLGAAHKMLGYSVTESIDASPRKISDSEKFLSALAAVQQRGAPAGLSPSLLPHVSFSALIAADEHSMWESLSAMSGMPFVFAETTRRGLLLSVVTGTLAQWRDAIVTGLSPFQEPSVREIFNSLLSQFDQLGLSKVWSEYERKTKDNLLYLEYKK